MLADVQRRIISLPCCFLLSSSLWLSFAYNTGKSSAVPTEPALPFPLTGTSALAAAHLLVIQAA